MKRLGILIFGFVTISISSIKAEVEPIIIADNDISYNPASSLYYFIDPSKQLKIDDITSSDYQDKFELNLKEIPNFGLESSSVWLKFTVQNSLSSSPYLEIDNPALDTIEYFLINNEDVVVHRYITGSHSKIVKRNIKTGELLIDLKLPDKEIYTCYLKINSSSSTILTPLRIASLSEFYELKQSESVWQGLYFGLILFLFIYNIFLFYSLKDSVYLYFALFIASMGCLFALFKGFGSQYLWINFPEINQFTPLIGATAGILMILFSAKFLDSRDKMPTLHMWLHALVGLYVLVIVLNIFGSQFLSINLLIYNTMIGLMFLVFLAIKGWRDGYEPAKFYLLAWSFYVVGVVTSFLRDNNFIEANIIVGNILQITSTISILFMSFALSKKINIYINNKNIAQELAIKTAIENERLISDQNQILETKVQQRTIDLEQTIKTLNNQQKELQEANVFKDKVFSIISHDLKSPISTLAGLLNLMKLESLNELERSNVLDKLEIALKNTRNLLDNILSWAYKNGNNQNKLTQIDLQKSVDDIFFLFQQLAIEKEITLRNKVDVGLIIESNSNMIQLVLRNLISNAIKFTPKSGSITVFVEEDYEDIHIHVKDTGIGMDAKLASKLFQLESISSLRGTENETGTGLGLILCKEFIDKFNGDISVVSAPNKGSTFTVKLSNALQRVEEQVA